MDAIEYLKERERMVGKGSERDVDLDYDHSLKEKTAPKEAVACVERWSLEHPLLTNARKFEETFGLKLGKNPKKIVASYNGEIFIPIPDEWWDTEYEEP